VIAGNGLGGGATQGDATLYVNFGGSGSANTVARSDHNHDGSYWKLGGNSGTNPSVNFLGTTDETALELRANNARILRLEPNDFSPNLIGGYSDNGITSGVFGATIGGGGWSGFENRVTDLYGTVGGGANNRAGNADTTVDNAIYATVGGGYGNQASGNVATVGGGSGNQAIGSSATISGGFGNQASNWYATVGGGADNQADGNYATIPGGRDNSASGDFSFAAGQQAEANHTGAFVWGDSTDANFASTAADQFSVRASGGVRFVLGNSQVSAESSGGERGLATLHANNTNTTSGMAAYLSNNSYYATTHFANAGAGQVLYLQNAGSSGDGTGGGDFILAVSGDQGDWQFRVTTSGEVLSDVGFHTPARDFAEILPAEDGLEPGDVLVIASDGKLARSTQANQPAVAGVYSTQPGFLGGQPMQGEKEGAVPLAVLGVVPVKASAENGAIRPGDLLVTASLPGHVMRASPITVDGVSFYPSGVLVGKALQGLEKDSGVILILVMLQ